MNKVEHALVLTAGLGTRLRPLTDVRAKPAIPVAGAPLIHRIIRQLVASGVTNLVLNLHHRPETLTGIVGDGSDLGARVRYSWEQPIVLGSAGGPRAALPLLGVETFLLVNGDTLSSVDIAELCAYHFSTGALVTLALAPNREFERYGGVQLAADGCVTGFVPRGPAAAGSFHFVGVQVAHRSAFLSVSPGHAANSIGEVYDRLIESRPGSIRGLVRETEFFDVGTPADYWRTDRAFAQSGSTVGARARIDPSAHISGSILWDDVSIAANVKLTQCIVSDGVTIPPGAEYTRAIVSRGADGAPLVWPLML